MSLIFRKYKLPNSRKSYRLVVLEPNVYEILTPGFDYGQFSEAILHDLAIYRQTNVSQGLLKGLDDADLSALYDHPPFEPGKEELALAKIRQFDEYYQDAIAALQHKYEYNLAHHNPKLAELSEQITTAMKVLAIDLLRQTVKAKRAYALPLGPDIDDEIVKLIERNYVDLLSIILKYDKKPEDLTCKIDKRDFSRYTSTERERNFVFQPIEEIALNYHQLVQAAPDITPELNEQVENTSQNGKVK